LVRRVFFLPITPVMIAPLLAGCVQTTSPVAIGPRNDLDSMAYGAPSYAAPAYSARAVADSGGAERTRFSPRIPLSFSQL